MPLRIKPNERTTQLWLAIKEQLREERAALVEALAKQQSEADTQAKRAQIRLLDRLIAADTDRPLVPEAPASID